MFSLLYPIACSWYEELADWQVSFAATLNQISMLDIRDTQVKMLLIVFIFVSECYV